MRHTQTRHGDKEHIMVDGENITECGEVVYGSAEIDTAHIAAKVADNLCERCRDAMRDEMTLYEMADETNV